MLEKELFALLDQTADAAYAVTDDGEVCSWNAAAEALFGYRAGDVIGRNIDEVFEARDALGTDREKEALLQRMQDVARQLVALATDGSDHAPVEPLSEQERRILTLFSGGKKPATIAHQLGISAQTLRNHLHHINHKLRTHNRLEAVIHAQRRGLID